MHDNADLGDVQICVQRDRLLATTITALWLLYLRSNCTST